MTRADGVVDLIDHRAEAGDLVDLADGVLWLRLPLPLRLNHVNVFILDDGPGWTVFDTGMNTPESVAVWERHLAGRLAGKPVTRVIVSHFHPDHVGLAGWLCERFGAELWMTEVEWLTARMMQRDAHGPLVRAAKAAHLAECAVPDLTATAMVEAASTFASRVVEPTPVYRRLHAGDVVTVGGRDWVCRIGGGHAPEQAALWCDEAMLLLIADQILPNISPNVSVWFSEPDDDPLSEYLDLLGAQADLPEEAAVLSAHGRPFRGLHSRAAWLAAHHDERLDELLDAMAKGPVTAWDGVQALFPQEAELDPHQKNFALGELLAHMNLLLRRGLVDRLPGRVIRYARK